MMNEEAQMLDTDVFMNDQQLTYLQCLSRLLDLFVSTDPLALACASYYVRVLNNGDRKTDEAVESAAIALHATTLHEMEEATLLAAGLSHDL